MTFCPPINGHLTGVCGTPAVRVRNLVQHVWEGFQQSQSSSGVHLPGKDWRRGGVKAETGDPRLSTRKKGLETRPGVPIKTVGQRVQWFQQELNGNLRLLPSLHSHTVTPPLRLGTAAPNQTVLKSETTGSEAELQPGSSDL